MLQSDELVAPQLSKRELEVVLTWFSSTSKREAAKELGVSEDTIRTHIARVRGKYMSVGRSASTKSDLMIRLMQDKLYSL
ncbi:Bacterial regulatory protein, LuxR family [Corynebacterium occultum]|uniref:Bacterial regulatory protein, LuxR family n=1 Tax=Corynebacterium occultum TaxID=2675219 RepID=A0A6B8W420_9CORY|nr:LuxR C-terminal-related transcriptional regulator [Corynebacterium occultum]QGU08294.1 Bacterial regulatory protein, LuxR family [Corynebacterium occultum]